ncbi:hypothetical protein DDB_G0270370 [Dictyostelium discoideum AX4]|uniref:Uncharacterized protein n=1 Tax=Dictyostelium discoideum TaxID=44689 RepID=Q55BT5_DICDI|nr:hypothetical protein DDB_G0270370 [Dictyostelium discoideum AX4]EAL72535.1 hypothetical protein DDB_G0270370 [Dictyostelium discoideum AX4]|eukprot:XP_646746.1 hypothetical protein DDB_G0270370 [Dictyostelium discoideum AX4]
MLSIQLGNIQVLNFFLNYPTFKNSEIIQFDSTVSNNYNMKKNSLEINSNQICHLIINNRLEILKYLYKERLLGISDFQDFSLDTRANSTISRKSIFSTLLQKDNYTFFANYLYQFLYHHQILYYLKNYFILY